LCNLSDSGLYSESVLFFKRFRLRCQLTSSSGNAATKTADVQSGLNSVWIAP
jgi:hypothetical protein